MNIKWDTSDFKTKTNELLKKVDETASKAVDAAGNKLLDLSQAVVPVITGNLKSTGKVKTKELTTEVSYDADYATKVHENPNSSHPKYLENPLKENVNTFLKVISQTLKEGIK
jgi:hypothetical protein